MSEKQPWLDTEFFAPWVEHQETCDRLGAMLVGKPDAITLSGTDARKIFEAALVGMHSIRKSAFHAYIRETEAAAKANETAA
jgi:hypothetical protein